MGYGYGRDDDDSKSFYARAIRNGRISRKGVMMWDAAWKALVRVINTLTCTGFEFDREKATKQWIETQKDMEPRKIDPIVFEQDLYRGDCRFSPSAIKTYRGDDRIKLGATIPCDKNGRIE